MRLRVGINGFGRIGRAVFRIAMGDDRFDVVAVNDIDGNIKNHAYLVKYDSHYGRLSSWISASSEEMRMMVDGHSVRFYDKADIAEVPWEEQDVNVVIDASGVKHNVTSAHRLVAGKRVPKVVVTHSPKDGVDTTVVFGVNEHSYDPAQHHVVSSSICDVISSAVVLNALEREYGVRSGFVTTLHPWLSYQNLLDGTVRSVSSPGHYWDDFALGRASNVNLIPKNTTLVPALAKVLPEVADRIKAMSFRVPTSAVTVSDMVIELDRPTSTEAVNRLFKDQAGVHKRVLGYQDEQLVSSDFMGIEQSVFVDGRWTMVAEGKSLRLVLWYDNEWGYSQRVADLAVLIGRGYV